MHPLLQQLLDKKLLWRVGGCRERKTDNWDGDPGLTSCSSQQSHCGFQSAGARFGISKIDQALPGGGLQFGQVHVWSMSTGFPSETAACKNWYPPLLLPINVIKNVFELECDKRLIVWVGRKVWPNPELQRSFLPAVNPQSIFIDANTKENRMWAATQALKSPGVAVVACDARGFKKLTLRQMQLAARLGGTLGFLFAPSWENAHWSYASTSWKVTFVPTANHTICWQLELLHAKGGIAQQAWKVIWDGTTQTLKEHSPNIVRADANMKLEIAAKPLRP